MKKVKIIGGYDSYIGQIGTFVRADGCCWIVEMPDGKQLCPYNHKASNPECEEVEVTEIPKQLPIFN